MGPYAAVAAGNLYAHQSARDMAVDLQLALESRAVIDQAKGILMERHELTADHAFQLLAQVSMNSNRTRCGTRIVIRALAERGQPAPAHVVEESHEPVSQSPGRVPRLR